MAALDKVLTPEQYATIKKIWQNNQQGVPFEDYLLFVCEAKGLQFDPNILVLAEEVKPKHVLTLPKRDKQSERADTHVHAFRSVDELLRVNNPLFKGNAVLKKRVCDCGEVRLVDYIVDRH